MIFALLPWNAAASFFMLTSRSDGTITQTGLPSTSAISVFRTRRGSAPSPAAACRADAVGVGIVGIGVEREGHARFLQRLRRAGDFGHAALIPYVWFHLTACHFRI